MNGSDILGIILAIYTIIVFVMTFTVGIATAYETENEKNVLKIAFWGQKELWKMLDYDDVNFVGKTIVIAVSSVFLLPINLLILTAYTLMFMAGKLWQLYKKIFRKRGTK